ncbi:CAAX prenyl protease 1 homolog [Orussus abietinus]|uniref:CAAX prenyl protease 1 homolog n=1 Tax=Orussus abietinus TaxID=222816 RepID=UPI0006257834|nr:CAAX prenyl protease 1 homolog [Orussus abietinus]
MYFRGKTGQKMLVLSEDIAGPNYLSTLDETLTTEEVVAIAAHELGHWKYCHYCINLVVNQLCLGLEMFSMFWLLKYQPLYTAFGFDDTPTSIGLTLLRYSCVTDMCRFFVRVVNRSTEFSADRHVKVLRKHRHLKSAMIKIEKNDGLFPVQDWLYSLCCNFQPTCYERIKAINNYIP